MRAKPDVFVGLDDNTVAVGFYDLSPLEVWDLAAGELVRKSDYLGQYCYSMASLLGQRIAAGWHNGTQNVVAVFDATTGKRVQELVGFGNHIYGMVLVEDRLLTMCLDQTLRVWNQDPEGKVRRWLFQLLSIEYVIAWARASSSSLTLCCLLNPHASLNVTNTDSSRRKQSS